MKIDCSNTKHVDIHKQQFDSIEKDVDYIFLDVLKMADVLDLNE